MPRIRIEAQTPNPTMPQIVLCPKCDARVSVTEKQAGRRVQCPRCTKPFLTVASADLDSSVTSLGNLNDLGDDDWMDLPPLDSDMVTAQKPSPMGQRRLVQAEQNAEEQATEQAANRETPRADVMAWTGRTFKIFLDPVVWFHWFGLSGFLGLAVYFTVINPLIGFGTLPIMVMTSLVVLSCGLAIVNAVANGHPEVDDWPTLDVFLWLESTLMVAAALMCSVMPVGLLCAILFPNSLATALLIILGAHLLFPFVLLSMLHEQSMTCPVSLDVIQSYRKSRRACHAFYFPAAATLMLPVVYFFVVPPTPTNYAIGAAIGVIAAFVYSAMLGCFAQSLVLAGLSLNAAVKPEESS